MVDTLKIAPELYSKPPLAAVPGMRADTREYTLVAADLITTQIIALGVIPAGHRLIGFKFESADLDTTSSTVTVTIGILNSYYNEHVAAADPLAAAYNSGNPLVANTAEAPELVSGQNILTASTTPCRAGGRVETSALRFTRLIGVDNDRDRIVGFKFPAIPDQVGAVTLTLITDAA